MRFFRNSLTKNAGMLVLSIYLIVSGLISLFHMSLGELSFISPLLALVAGVLLIMGR